MSNFDPVSVETGLTYEFVNQYSDYPLNIDKSSTNQAGLFADPSGNVLPLVFSVARNTSQWNICTEAGSSTAVRCLDVYTSDNTKPYLAPPGTSSGQQWTISPWGDGTFMLTNDFSGPGLLLDTFSNTGGLFLEPPNHSGQHWSFLQVYIPGPTGSATSSTTSTSRTSNPTSSSTRTSSTSSSAAATNTSSNSTNPATGGSSKSSLPLGAKIGIGAGAGVLVLVIIGLVAFILFMRKRSKKPKTSPLPPPNLTNPLMSHYDDGSGRAQLDDTSPVVVKVAEPTFVAELGGSPYASYPSTPAPGYPHHEYIMELGDNTAVNARGKPGGYS